MKKVLTALLSSLLLVGMTTAVSVAEAPENVTDIYHYYGEITYTCMDAAVIEDNSIIGEIIGGGSIADGGWYENAFDDMISTYYDGSGEIFDMWVGLKTEKPKVVKSFSVATQDNDGDYVPDRRHAIWGSRLQGSNDGIIWEDIYVYTYDDYEDYANDTENIWLTIELPDNEEEYTFFRLINNGDGANAIAEIQLYAAKKGTTVYPALPAYNHIIFAEEYPDLDVAFGEGYPGSTSAGLPECAAGTLLKGAVATSVNSNGTFAYNGNVGRYNPANAFDGNNTTFFYAFNQSAMYHPILILDQAYELKEIRLFTYPSAAVPTTDHLIQGSNDGENWVTIVHLPTIETDSYVVFTPEAHNYEGYVDYSDCWVGSGSYVMYRYINTNGVSINGVSDIEFYGVPAEATEVTPDMIVEPELSVNHYPYEIDVTDVSVTVSGWVMGTVIGGGGGWNGHDYEHAFDGELKTYFDPNYKSPMCWVGLKMDAPTVLTGVKIYPVYQVSELGRLGRIEGGFIQGSNDGENWTTLITYTAEDIPTTAQWIEKTCSSKEAYTYFRYVNNGYGNSEAAEILFFGEDPSSIVVGDIDGDGILNIQDALRLFREIMLPTMYPGTYLGSTDFNGDGVLDIQDALRLFRGIMLPSLYPLT